MPQLKNKTEEEIKILVSFLDEESEDILKNIEYELLTLDETSNQYLISLLPDIENDFLKNKLKTIITRNSFRFSGDKLIKWAKTNDLNCFELLLILTTLEYPDIDKKRIKSLYDSQLKSIWLLLSPENSAFENAKLLRTFFFHESEIIVLDDNKAQLNHFFLNNVFYLKETTVSFLNVLYLSFANDLNLPVIPCLINELLFMAFQNKPPYEISLFDSPFLFFIHNKTLMPFPESKIRQRFNIKNDDELPFKPFTKKDIAVMLLKYMAHCYDIEKRPVYSLCTKELIIKLDNHFNTDEK